MTAKVPAAVADLSFTLNGREMAVADPRASLLEVLRDEAGITSVKDGCSPQGQCGCCTVWIDGQPRVACVTPVSRVAGRQVITVEGLDDGLDWGQRLSAAGASQCGFCTPGIIMRLAALPEGQRNASKVRSALAAHLCRCTGWQTIIDAAATTTSTPTADQGRDPVRAARRAAIEGRATQQADAHTALGRCPFAADTAPPGHAVAELGADGRWEVAATTAAARRAAGRVPGRNSTARLVWPVPVPAGQWAYTLQTTWVEPAYLELDASWCLPGGSPAPPLANGGAFGAKQSTWIADEARRLADENGRPVLARLSREEATRRGPKRPPLAIGIDGHGRGAVAVARTPGIAASIRRVAPDWTVDEVDVDGPPTSADLRDAGWAEVAAVIAAIGADPDGWCTVASPDGARAAARLTAPGGEQGDREQLEIRVACGPVLDDVVLRSYCIGAAHMALGWVRREAIAVDGEGRPTDLTIRSFGILRATEMPDVSVTIEADQRSAEPVNGSDAVFAAVAAAAWLVAGLAPRWPTMRT